VNQQDLNEVQHFFSRKNHPAILGSPAFGGTIRNRLDFLRHDKEIVGIEILSVDAEDVINAVSDVCQVTKKSLLDQCAECPMPQGVWQFIR